jgi:hypothetical protein
VPLNPTPTSGITTRTSAKLAAATAAISSSPPSSAVTTDGGVPHSFEEVASLSLGTSLPEDRSLWPFFVSGGAVVTSLSTANSAAQRNAKAEGSDDEVFEEDDDEDGDVEVEALSSVSGSYDHDPERIDDKDDVDGEEREDSGYASSGGGVSASVAANGKPVSQRAPPSRSVSTRSARARSHSTSTSASVSVTRGGGGLLAVPETNDQDEGKMHTRSRSRSTASNTARPSTTTSSGLGATRPARLSSQTPSTSSHGGHHHHRSSSTGYHPYGSYRSSTTAVLSSAVSTSLGSAGVNISGRARSHSNSRGVSSGTPSSVTSTVSIPPPPPPVPTLLSAGQRGVAIIDGSGSHHHHPYAFGAPSSFSYGYPRGTGSSSFAGSGPGIVNPSSVSVSMPRSSIISNIRSLDEEDESIADAESVDDDSCASGGSGAPHALDLRDVGTSALSELEEHEYERVGGGKRDRDDDQETVDGSWDGEDDPACGMAMDMDL